MSSAIPRKVVTLGIVSLLTDLSSEMVVPVLPLFLTATLGGSAGALGWIEGVAEATSYLLRALTGWLSDRMSRRKPFLVLGYGISTFPRRRCRSPAPGWPSSACAPAIDSARRCGARRSRRWSQSPRSPRSSAEPSDCIGRSTPRAPLSVP